MQLKNFEIVVKLSLSVAAVLLGFGTSVPAQADCSLSRPTDFQIFDALLHNNKPDLIKYGITRAHVIDRDFWEDDKQRQIASPSKISSIANSLPQNGAPIIIDIEHWRLDKKTPEWQNNVKKLDQIARWFKAADPNRPIGFYGLFPLGDYWRAIDAFPGSKAEWMRDNDGAVGVTKNVDYIFPSLYTYYEDREGWVKRATASICEARRNSDKPVYAFIWPSYHSSSTLAGQSIPDDYWRLQLETMRDFADGVVIWGGFDLQAWRAKEWDEQADWWVVTKEVVKEWRKEGT